jgi:uncharacterized protein YjbI with pentapeptide repeats
MANPEHLQILEQGVEAWNAWRRRNRDITPDLEQANLSGAFLHDVDLTWVYLSKANLTGADLHEADLSWADLYETNLHDANLTKKRREAPAFMPGMDRRWARRAQCPRAQQDPRSA